MTRLKGKVAVVTGSSRGAGRGIALILGEAGATVYATGRSVKGASTRPELPNTTIDGTAELVRERGGVCIPVQVDHTVDEQVKELFERVEKEQGKLDLLVNNAWGGYEDYDERSFEDVFWRQPVARLDRMWNAGVRATHVTTHLAAPLFIRAGRGLIVNITLETADNVEGFPLPYGVAKLATNFMTSRMARDFRSEGLGVAVVGLSPGWMRTEAVLKGEFPHTKPTLEFREQTQSVEYIGRAVLALATDPQVLARTGVVLSVGKLARDYGFTDIDGRQPS